MAQPIPRYNKDDWQGLNKAMNTQLAELEGEKTEASTEEFWTKFKTSLLEAMKYPEFQHSTLQAHQETRPGIQEKKEEGHGRTDDRDTLTEKRSPMPTP